MIKTVTERKYAHGVPPGLDWGRMEANSYQGGDHPGPDVSSGVPDICSCQKCLDVKDKEVISKEERN